MADAATSQVQTHHLGPEDPDVLSGKKLWIELRTPEGAIYSGHAKTIRVPGTKGFFGVLPKHAPLMSSLEVGYTYIQDPIGVEWKFVTGAGFVGEFGKLCKTSAPLVEFLCDAIGVPF